MRNSPPSLRRPDNYSLKLSQLSELTLGTGDLRIDEDLLDVFFRINAEAAMTNSSDRKVSKKERASSMPLLPPLLSDSDRCGREWTL